MKALAFGLVVVVGCAGEPTPEPDAPALHGTHLDPAFGRDGYVSEKYYSRPTMALDGAGRIYVSYRYERQVCRLDHDGAPDPSFGDGCVILPMEPTAMVASPTGVVVSGARQILAFDRVGAPAWQVDLDVPDDAYNTLLVRDGSELLAVGIADSSLYLRRVARGQVVARRDVAHKSFDAIVGVVATAGGFFLAANSPLPTATGHLAHIDPRSLDVMWFGPEAPFTAIAATSTGELVTARGSRLHTDFSDRDLGAPIAALAPAPDGLVAVTMHANAAVVSRWNAEGEPIASFGTAGTFSFPALTVIQAAVDRDGSIVTLSWDHDDTQLGSFALARVVP